MTRLTTRTASATAAAASELCACNTMYSPYNSSRYVRGNFSTLFYDSFSLKLSLYIFSPSTHFSISFLIFTVFLMYVQAVQPLGGRGLLSLVCISRRTQDIPVASFFFFFTSTDEEERKTIHTTFTSTFSISVIYTSTASLPPFHFLFLPIPLFFLPYFPIVNAFQFLGFLFLISGWQTGIDVYLDYTLFNSLFLKNREA